VTRHELAALAPREHWAAVFLLAAASPLPGPERVRNTAREVLARPEFQVDGSTEAAEGLWAYLHRLGSAVLDLFRGLFESLYTMSPILAWLVVGALVLTLLLLLGHIGYTLYMVLRKRGRETALDDAIGVRTIKPAELAKQAESAEAGGDHILGVRLLFRACLAELEEREGRTFRPGATNREHLARYRQTPLYDWLAQFVWVIDSKWYGQGTCLAADFVACHEAYERITTLAATRAAEGQNAQHA
jgi:uncharacterized protein DUF4129